MAGQNDSKELYRASSESCQPNGTRLKESIFKSNSKINSTVTTRTYGFCQKNGSERGQTQDWYMNEKMVVLPACLKGRCCSSGCMGIVLH